MVQKKAVVTKTQSALVKREPKTLSIHVRALDTLNDALKLVAEAVSDTLAPKQAIPLFEQLKNAEDAVKELASGMRNSLLDLLKEKGTRATDKGTLNLNIDGWYLEARPQKTGLDGKKVEALLRAKEMDPEVGMDATLSYTVNDAKLNELVRLKKVTKAELETCRYDLSYAVQRPKRAMPYDGD